MARVIEAKAIISGEDKLGPLIDKLGKKFENLAKGSKQAEAVDKMATAIGKVRSQMAAIEKFNAAKIGFQNAQKNFATTRIEVEKTARALAQAAKPSAELERNMRRAQAAVTSAARAFDHQKIAVLGAKRELEGLGGSISNTAGQQQRLAAAVDRVSAAMRRQANWAARRRELGILGSYAGLAVGHKSAHGARETLRTYREFDKERRFGKAVMGITDEQQAPLVAQAIHLGATTKFNDIQVLEAQRELAARGLTVPQVKGLIGPAANLGQALDLKLPESVKQMEGALFGFKRDMSTLASAQAAATRTADMQVKAAKVSGMQPEDLTQLYKYGATPARMAGMSEETLLAFGGILKKANMGGDESGVAFRALMAATQSPTRKGRETLLANGLNFKDYQRNPSSLALNPFVENVAAQYGVKLDAKAQAGLGSIFSNKELIGDPSKFTPAVISFLKESLSGNDAKSLRSISGMANRYRDASMQGVDTDRFVADLMTKLAGNLQFANALFGSKQGGRIATALGDPETFKHMLDEIKNHSEGYSAAISSERMAGFDGAVSRFEGAVKNLETAIGRSFDTDGKGGPLTTVTNWMGQLTQSMAELNPTVLAVGTGFAGLVGAFAGVKGIISVSSLLFGAGGLKGSAVALDGAAAALTRAAVALGAPASLTKTAVPTAISATSGGIWARGAAALPFIGPAGAVIGAGFGLYGMRQETAPFAGMNSGERMRKFRGGSMADVYRRAFNEERERLGVPLIGSGGATPVQAELKGSAEVKGEARITIDIPGLPSRTVGVPLTGALNANGPGSVGKSSPDASSRPSGVGHN